MVAAAWSEMEADRGEPVGDSPRDTASPLAAISRGKQTRRSKAKLGK